MSSANIQIFALSDRKVHENFKQSLFNLFFLFKKGMFLKNFFLYIIKLLIIQAIIMKAKSRSESH